MLGRKAELGQELETEPRKVPGHRNEIVGTFQRLGLLRNTEVGKDGSRLPRWLGRRGVSRAPAWLSPLHLTLPTQGDAQLNSKRRT